MSTRRPKYKMAGMHYHYSGNLEELFSMIVGKRILLKPQNDHKKDSLAIMVLMDGKLLGYVSKKYRLCIREIFKKTGMSLLLGIVTRVVRKTSEDESDMLEFELEGLSEDVQNADSYVQDERDFSQWEWEGKHITQCTSALELNTYLTYLQMLLKAGEKYGQEMQTAMDTIHRNAWIDMSRENQLLYGDIIKMLHERDAEDEHFSDMRDALDQVMSHVNGKESVKRLCQYLEETSRGDEVKALLEEQDVKTFAERIPAPIQSFLKQGAEEVVGQIAYMPMPRDIMWGLYTIICLNMRIITSFTENVHVPIRERLVRVDMMLDVAKEMPFESKVALLMAISMQCPNLTEEDNKVLKDTFGMSAQKIYDIIIGSKNVAAGGKQMNMEMPDKKMLQQILPKLLEDLNGNSKQ